MRRLSNRQVAVLAAIERLGQPTQDELLRDLPGLSGSETRQVVNALVIRGLVVESGSPLRYAAAPRDDTRAGSRDSVAP